MKRGLLALGLAALMSGFFMSGAWAQRQPGGQSVQGVAVNRATVNSSVTITTGNTFQQVLASNLGTSTQRQSLTIQNNNTNTDSCWVYLGATASATKAASIILAVGQAYTRYFPYVPSDAVQVTCTSTSDSIYVDSN